MRKLFGYAGKLLEVDLSRMLTKEIPLDDEHRKNYISGVGFTTKFVYEGVPVGADPLGPDNILAFGVGVLAGTNVPTACRTEASAKSPATGLFGTSNSGNFWGSELKYAGFDGIIIRGKAPYPVYLYVHDNEVQLLKADYLWGKDSWETFQKIRSEHKDEEIQVACIGQGGEKLCRFASIQNGPYDAWGRTGLGAVMGSKNLKAIAVRGTGSITVYDKKAFVSNVSKCREAIYKSPFFEPFQKFGTMLATIPYYEFGALPGRNFQTGTIDNWLETRSRKQVHKYSKRGIACISCPISCAHWVEVKEGPFQGLRVKDMEVTPLMGFAAGCDVDNIPAVAYLSMVCQKYGIDMVSTASSVAFVMELFQRGIIDEGELGFTAQWGDLQAVLKIIDLIVNREGIGNSLAEGTRRAAQAIPGAEYYAMQIKGLEIPMADARGRWSTWTFGNLTNIRGGDHLRCRNPVENLRFNENPVQYKQERFSFSDEIYNALDMPELIKQEIFESDTRNVSIPKMAKWSEDLISLYNCVGLCIRPPVLQAVGPTLIAEIYESLTGFQISSEEMQRAGERIWNMQKLFNLREGETKESSCYPARFYKEELPGSASTGKELSPEKVAEALAEYYEARGWNSTGVPSQEKLKNLGLIR